MDMSGKVDGSLTVVWEGRLRQTQGGNVSAVADRDQRVGVQLAMAKNAMDNNIKAVLELAGSFEGEGPTFKMFSDAIRLYTGLLVDSSSNEIAFVDDSSAELGGIETSNCKIAICIVGWNK